MGSSKHGKILEAAAPASNLTSEEYFLWSQIKTKASVRDLLALCPWPEELTLQKIESLIKKKSARWEKSQKTYAPEIEKRLREDENLEIELDEDFRAEILAKYAEPEDQNAYETLGLKAKASENEVRIAHIASSKKFHPDRFFKKNLGHYKPKLESLFTRIQKAYALLKNPIEKEALDRMMAIRARPAQAEGESAQKRGFKLDKEMEKFGKAEHSYKAGLEYEKNHDYVGAYNSFVIAHQIDPKRDVFEKAIDRVRPLMNGQKACRLLEEIKSEASTSGATPELMKRLEDVLRIDPQLEDALLWMGRFILELGPASRIKDAKEMLLRARASNLTSAEPCYYLARAYEALGELKAAIREVSEALKRNPKHLPSKKLLEKLQ